MEVVAVGRVVIWTERRIEETAGAGVDLPQEQRVCPIIMPVGQHADALAVVEDVHGMRRPAPFRHRP